MWRQRGRPPSQNRQVCFKGTATWGADEDDDDYRSGVPMMMRRRMIKARLGAASARWGPDRYIYQVEKKVQCCS